MTTWGLEVRVKNNATGQESQQVFDRAPVRIGRNELNDLVLREPFISQWHAVTWFEPSKEDAVRYVDLGSTNGTMFGGKRVEPNVNVELGAKNEVHIGPLQISFAREVAAAKQRAPRRSSAPPSAVSQAASASSARTQGVASPNPLLSAFCQAYLELRKGSQQFGKDMGIRVIREQNVFQTARSGDEILQYLSDCSEEEREARIQELSRAFAEIGIHQVAFLNGVVEGVRSLLDQLAPHQLDAGTTLAHQSLGKFFRMLAPLRDHIRWRSFLKRHASFTEEDRFTREVFGKRFARAYHTVTGGE